MPDAQTIERIESKFNMLVGDLDERGRRRWAATDAIALGRGGITLVALATGLPDRTIRTGIQELHSDNPLDSGRQRRSGGGRKPLEQAQQDLVDAVDRLVEPTERGDPQSPLRWTCKSLSNLQRELRQQGYSVGRSKISRILRGQGYSLQGNRKTREGTDHPDRNAQFEHMLGVSLPVTGVYARQSPLMRKRRKPLETRRMLAVNIVHKESRWR